MGDVVDRMRRASELEDWQRVLELGGSTGNAGSAIDLMIGRALFSLGRHREALARFETGLQADDPGGVDIGESAYFAGMAAMLTGDLERARAHFGMAIERASDKSWAGDAAVRGLAQVETELGSFDEALHLLEGPARKGGPSPFTHVLRARAFARKGNARSARWELSAAGRLIPEPEPDAAHAALKSAASMLVGMAEVYVELGHTPEAHNALDTCTRALETAGWPDIPAAAYLLVFRAGAHRLDGRLPQAERLLDTCATHERLARDLAPMILRERARVAATLGEHTDAERLWREASDAFQGIGYRQQAEACLREIEHGPPVASPHPSATEELALMAREANLPDGVIIDLRMPESSEAPETELAAMLRIADAVASAVEQAHAGEYDGWEVGDGAFSIFCYGDPDTIWSAIEQHVARSAAYGGSAVLRKAGKERKIELTPRTAPSD